MKSIQYKTAALAIVIAICGFALDSCKEVGPTIDLTNGRHNTTFDTVYVESAPPAPETRNVLIEMFTGVSCINCPTAHTIVDNLIANSNGRVIGVAMHSTDPNTSQDGSLPDTREVLGCADAQTIVSFFKDESFRPMGAVNRVVHTNIFGNTSIYDDRSNWGGYTSTELATTTSAVNLGLTKMYIDSSHQLIVDVELHYTAAQPDSDKISIFLTQDSIVTSQLQPNNSDDPTYVHNGILRTAVTAALGDKINATLVAGTVVKREYTYKITNPLWKPENMNIVSFVHRYQNGNNNILQSKTIKLK